jgi:hypothetical protein
MGMGVSAVGSARARSTRGCSTPRWLMALSASGSPPVTNLGTRPGSTRCGSPSRCRGSRIRSRRGGPGGTPPSANPARSPSPATAKVFRAGWPSRGEPRRWSPLDRSPAQPAPATGSNTEVPISTTGPRGRRRQQGKEASRLGRDLAEPAQVRRPVCRSVASRSSSTAIRRATGSGMEWNTPFRSRPPRSGDTAPALASATRDPRPGSPA